jgi:uncharacterized protein YjbI with pentapeptide repeats
MIARRTILTALFFGLPPFKTVAVGHRRRITQDELDDAIAQHARWLDGRKLGRRAKFWSCDLSGLDLGANNPNQVLLRGADFTEADLRGMHGNDVNFHHASLQYADLSHSHLKAPVFSGANLDNADCSNVVWGWPTSDSKLRAGTVLPSDQAVFMGARLSGVIFDEARVRGYFNGCSLTGASMQLADFSQSKFAGNESLNRFAQARLIGTKFHFATITSALFNNAVVEGADFLGADLHPRIAAHLLERNSINVRTQISRRFSHPGT